MSLSAHLPTRREIRAALRAGVRSFFFGNGGSAADALHLAAELVVGCARNRKGLASIALTTNPSVLTAPATTMDSTYFFAAN